MSGNIDDILEGSKKYMPRTLFVLNSDGQLLRKLNLDTRGTILAVSESHNLLLLKSFEPEVGYRAYDLDEILAGF